MVEVEGEGAGQVPLDPTHLVVRAIEHGLQAAGVTRRGSEGALPQRHSAFARARLVGRGRGRRPGGRQRPCRASGFDTAQRSGTDPAVVGVRGASRQRRRPPCWAARWCRGPNTRAPRRAMRRRRCGCTPTSTCFPAIPEERSSTAETRVLLPDQVSHDDARFNVSRAALLVVALTERPDLLMAATEDVLHQPQRAAAMPASAEYLRLLRRCGVAAVLSGAGPAVIALSTAARTARRGAGVRRRERIHRQRDDRRRRRSLDVGRGRSELTADHTSHGESGCFLLPAPKRVILAAVQQSQRLCLRRH